MTRKWITYPQGITLQTLIGPVTLTFTSDEHVCVRAEAPNPLTVYGVAITINLHMSAQGESWDVMRTDNGSTYGNFYADKHNPKNYNDRAASDAARRKILAVVVPAVNAFILEHGEVLADARHADLNNKLHRMESDVAKLEREITERQAKIEQTRAAIAELESSIN